jgi:flavin-dependent dehydrogenase
LNDAEGRYDVAILGGGLAGLTLALQLKRQRPDTSIVVAEKRAGPAPEAAFKVGESTVEVSAYYFAEVCGMLDHLKERQLPKCGLRFFFPAGDNSDITRRVEHGDDKFAPVTTFQLDRGRFENALAERCVEHGVDVRQGCRMEDVDLDAAGDHTVRLTQDGAESSVRARWVVDCAGRAFLLKRKLGLEKDVAHTINSSWWRVGNGFVDIEDWGRHDEAWMGRMDQPGMRKHSTNHLVGEGYWVWLIPLASGAHSIGIVADPRFHPFERISTFDAALDWLREHEPQLAETMEQRRGDVQDFLKVEDFSYGCERVFSPERWALTGEAGAFIDPLYSPGSDYIALGNTFAGDLIKKNLDGQDISELVEIYNGMYLFGFESLLSNVWTDHYAEFGDAEVFSAKITFDYVNYWGFQALRVYYDKLCDRDFGVAVAPQVQRLFALTGQVAQLFRDWHAAGQPENPEGFHCVPSSFSGLWDRLLDLKAGLDEETLRARTELTVGILEGMAVVYLHKAAKRLPGGPPDPERKVDPYKVNLDAGGWEDTLYDGEAGLTLAEARGRAAGLENILLDDLVSAAR